MDQSKILSQAVTSFKIASEHLETELSRMRTGRANSAMVEGVMVEAYGSLMPLKQVATINAPEPQLLQITPFDPSILPAITTAIRNNQALGFNPSDDGRVVRVVVPPLTQERRQEIAKLIGEKLEDAAVRMRSARHEAFRQLEQLKKDKQIGEDDVHRSEKMIDEAMAKSRQQMDRAAKTKETEITTL